MTRISSDTVVFGTGASMRVAPGYVTFEGAFIQEVGEGAPPDDGQTTEHLPHHLVSPAFVNAHTHVALHALRGALGASTGGNVVEDLFYRVEASLTPEDVRAFARIGSWESLLSGVGLVWDHYFFGDALAAGIADTGLSAVVAPTLQDLSGPGALFSAASGSSEQRAGGADGALQTTHDLDAAGLDTIHAALGPHATDTVSPELWSRVLEASETLGVPVHAHLAQSVEEVARARTRSQRTPVGYLESLGVLERARCVFAHALYVDRAEMRALAPRHTLVCCPYGQLIFGFVARLDEWEKSGVRWTVATDCAASNDSMSLRKELRFASGTRTLGTSYSDVYESFLAGEASAESVWLDRTERWNAGGSVSDPRGLLDRVWSGAGALHPKVRAGALERGALANLVAWDLHHPAFWPSTQPLTALVLGDVDGAIDAMWVGGKPVGEPGNFHQSILSSPLYLAHREEASGRLAALMGRL